MHAAVAPVRRTAARLAALLVATLALGVAAAPVGPGLGGAPGRPAAAAPGDDEGGTPALRAQLDAASKGWLDAKAALDRSAKRQKQLTDQLTTIEAELTVRDAKVGEIAGVAYRTGRLGTAVGAAQQRPARRASWTAPPRWTRSPPTRTGRCAT